MKHMPVSRRLFSKSGCKDKTYLNNNKTLRKIILKKKLNCLIYKPVKK